MLRWLLIGGIKFLLRDSSSQILFFLCFRPNYRCTNIQENDHLQYFFLLHTPSRLAQSPKTILTIIFLLKKFIKHSRYTFTKLHFKMNLLTSLSYFQTQHKKIIIYTFTKLHFKMNLLTSLLYFQTQFIYSQSLKCLT